MKVSVIIPCYNEEEVLPLSHKRFSQVMESTAHDYELILQRPHRRTFTRFRQR